MKKYTSLALIGAIVAGIAGFASMGATSATSLMTIQGTDMHETGQMIGHVTYEVRGVDGQIKHYFQSDNVITNSGKDCSAAAIFDTDDPVCDTPGNFAYIAIGNATGATALVTDTALAVSAGNGGEMDRSGLIDALIDSASTNPSGTVVSIATTTPFVFDYLGSAGTKVTQSGLFDNDGTAPTDNMFAIRDISSGTGGLSVTNADTLSVTWTITLT
jgi:hypothetical protein